MDDTDDKRSNFHLYVLIGVAIILLLLVAFGPWWG